jgi:hypothetical protein
MKLLITKLSPLPCYLVSLKPKHSPQPPLSNTLSLRSSLNSHYFLMFRKYRVQVSISGLLTTDLNLPCFSSGYLGRGPPPSTYFPIQHSPVTHAIWRYTIFVGLTRNVAA